MMVKRNLGPEAKKAYVKPQLTRNDLLVDITFLSASGGPPGTLVGGPTPKPRAYNPNNPNLGPGGTIAGGAGMPGELGGGDDGLGGAGTIGGGSAIGGGTMVPGTGGAPGTVL